MERTKRIVLGMLKCKVPRPAAAEGVFSWSSLLFAVSGDTAAWGSAAEQVGKLCCAALGASHTWSWFT